MDTRGIETMCLCDLILELIIPVPEGEVDVAFSAMQPAGANGARIRFLHSTALRLTYVSESL